MTVIILAVLVLGFWLGVWAAHVNFVKPSQEAEAGLRKELGDAQIELATHEFRGWQRKVGALVDAIGYSWVTKDCLEKHTHFDFREPKIPHRAPSDVFKIDSIDDLIEGTR